MECHKSSGQNISDFYQEACTCSEVSTYHKTQKRIGETILYIFVSVNDDFILRLILRGVFKFIYSQTVVCCL